MRKRIATLHATAAHRPPGYVEDVLSEAPIDGEWYEVTEERWAVLCAKYRKPLPPPDPAMLAHLERQARVCRGCGDSPLDGA